MSAFGSELYKIAHNQEVVAKEFVTTAVKQEKEVEKAVQRLQTGSQIIDQHLNEATKQIQWSWQKRLTILATIIVFSVSIGFTVGNLLLTKFPPMYSQEIRQALNDSLFIQNVWPKLNNAEREQLKKLARE